MDFDKRVAFFLKKARRAQRLRASDADIRDLVFQGVIFLTGAATESYIKLLIESWLQRLRLTGAGAETPEEVRAFMASRRLSEAFAKYQYSSDERALLVHIASEVDLWSFMNGGAALPPYVTGASLHAGAAYPSTKNLKRLFSRVGLPNVTDRLSKNLGRDVEVLIEGFQSVRTALAHAAPPMLTIKDVESLLADSSQLVGAIDRVFYSHVRKHGGNVCWPAH